MGLFSKRKPSTTDAIAEFWSWWQAEGAAKLEAGIESRDFGALPALVESKISAIDNDLGFELGPGKVAQHRFVLTSGGVAELRPRVERWKLAAPAVTETWEFATSREASDEELGGTVNYSGHDVDLGLTRFVATVDTEARRVDVLCVHPAFATMGDNEAMGVTFLALDWVLGEDSVERAIGAIEAVPSTDAPTITGAELVALVGEAVPSLGEDSWAILEGESNGSPMLVMANRGVRWIDLPLFDEHHTLEVSYSEQTPAGYPLPEALDRLRAIEDALTEALGADAHLAAVVTWKGTRTFHVYSDSEKAQAREAIVAFAGQVGARLSTESDPGWRAVRSYLG